MVDMRHRLDQARKSAAIMGHTLSKRWYRMDMYPDNRYARCAHCIAYAYVSPRTMTGGAFVYECTKKGA